MEIKKIAYAIGSKKNSIKNLSYKNYNKIIKITGIKNTFNVSNKEDIISLSVKAAKKIIKNDKIDVLILITQTPKFNIPPNSYIIQKKLKLSNNCLVFDLNLGCSGYVYGLKIAQSLFVDKKINKILIITADNYSRYTKKLNVKVLFSDAATATLLQRSDQNCNFEFYSNGNDYMHLSQTYSNYEKSITDNNLNMDGNKIFNFSLNDVPNLMKKFIKKNNIDNKKIDYILLHQASRVVNENLARKMKIDKGKFLNNYINYGNTVSSSIPILIAQNIKKLRGKKTLICGFGVGLSAAVCNYEF
jgi:3-oxoacyl-[acyl-carrier-protein] synthase III